MWSSCFPRKYGVADRGPALSKVSQCNESLSRGITVSAYSYTQATAGRMWELLTAIFDFAVWTEVGSCRNQILASLNGTLFN